MAARWAMLPTGCWFTRSGCGWAVAGKVGDAPDGVAVPVVLGCYTGELDDGDDSDEYWLLPGWHGVFGMVMRFWGLEGCTSVTITLEDTGASASLSLCEGDVKGIAVIGLHDVHVEFSDGPATYQFAFE